MLRGNLHFLQTWLGNNHNALKLLIALLALASLACNAFAGNLEPSPEPPQVSPRPTATTTPGAIAATATLMESGEAAITTLVDLNVRSGPGVQYDRVGFLSKGTSVPVIGADKQSGWWKITCPGALTTGECWVAGGVQYVAEANVQDVPTAVPPPTPTTIPPTVEAGLGMLAYLEDGQLYAAGLDLDQNPPAKTADTRQISSGDGVERFVFSPDGHRIAYVAGTESSNSLNVVNLDGGDHRTLVTSSILPLREEWEGAQAAVLIDAIQWLPDARGVAFNTRVQNLIGPGGFSQEDLWLATLDGELINSFPAGEGGGVFAFESTDDVVFSRTAELARADLTTLEQDILLQFERINTASEYIYYPEPNQTGSGTYLAVPAPDPWAAGAVTTLWRAPLNRPAVEIGQITDVPLDQPVNWSSDGRQITYVKRSGSSEEPALRMFTAAGDGSGAMPYAGAPSLNFFGWKPGDDQFLYAGTGFYATGRPQAPPAQVLLPAGQVAIAGSWLTGDNYVIVVIDPADQGWEIQSANTSGDTRLLVKGSGLNTGFAIWLPGE